MAAPCVGSLEMCRTHEPGDDSDGEKEGDINHEVGGEASIGEVEDNQALTVGMEAEAGEKSHDEDKEPLETLKGATLNNCGDPGRQDPSPLSGSLLDMFIAIASSRVPIKSQQKGDPEFSQEQKMSMLLDLYNSKPLIFLERFRKVLAEEHLGCFSHLCGDYTAEFYCKEIRRASHKRVGRTRVRNKRYAALQQLITAGEYFSDEQMRLRDPLLYEHYVGQYLTEEEVMSQNSKDLSEACSLSDVLLTSYQEQALQRRLIAQIEQEESCMEEEEEESEEEEQAVDSEERALLREEFISRMHQRFLDGKDQDFDYSEVDDNPDFDNLDIVTHDEEERYFDDDDDDDDTEEMEAEEIQGENGRTDKGHTFCVGTH